MGRGFPTFMVVAVVVIMALTEMNPRSVAPRTDFERIQNRGCAWGPVRSGQVRKKAAGCLLVGCGCIGKDFISADDLAVEGAGD